MINESRGSVDISYTLLKLSLFSKSIYRVYIYIYIKNWGSFVLLQIRANVVTNWGVTYAIHIIDNQIEKKCQKR